MGDGASLERFVEAQAPVFATALAEIPAAQSVLTGWGRPVVEAPHSSARLVKVEVVTAYSYATGVAGAFKSVLQTTIAAPDRPSAAPKKGPAGEPTGPKGKDSPR